MLIDFGFSPCPNDTFMFWAWAHQRVETELSLQPNLADIQELNLRALGSDPLPLTKVSASAYLEPLVQERYRLLDVGAALGRGCGPLIVSKRAWTEQDQNPMRLAVPGLNTTACRLARAALGPKVSEWIELRYDEVMPAVIEGQVDAGVIIHESRFTYQGLGLHLALDLGQWWEKRSGLPLPLGVMVARRDLEDNVVAKIEQALSASLKQAWTLFQAPDSSQAQELWQYLRDNAIELDDTTIASHIELYVNEFSLSLGGLGREALGEFSKL